MMNWLAYARILKSDDDLEPVVIGRVIVSEALRGEKVGAAADE
ncbi:putative acyltransferase with acyl-CoA N-acyltransferase domain [Escherichia coli]|uniref:Putative acyltransferase with acyl-CoA N-acyltransferase domain n=1 Tax=Escherichia coli TaxID=562 RepID=A0A376L8Y4_ECOLX|nr:putative acyltransferase with acyl-CoA N-acyltransferase domain [Escherichia coli]